MKGLDDGSIISGGRIPLYSYRYEATQFWKRNLRVCFMFLIPEREVTTLWERNVVRLESSGEIFGAN